MADPAWDGRSGTAGGATFGAALAELAAEREVSREALARESGLAQETLSGVLAGTQRVGVSALACFAMLLRLRPIEFLQRVQILSLEAYAYGLDPLYFLPEGPTRYDARIYMREINPRHQVPEGDMTRRNATLKVLAEDPLLDARGKFEVELAYLLRAAVQQTGGTL
ncbi:MAG: helix-turn-helix domain-containing protein [Candidatus Eremiobacteraeota bacterium]|nr:helix-turn-helix domain-containing protein [Candidatus Eremiobacteraeota bacterium]MBV8332424.1 helix-turn-helix domain-containing protein [Candidatus Eremiobacteraeota bacterium]MBV8435637.1 helix-turn-helix domain-containing protein [Candidatus Eremiobacteraeota bacterium]MBV8584162.1 helix-turn-helix domain-containing protein [Candidatus Eremiobacteraeota bacterium]MBV8656091.1 helix-turn-helix domain-containing protein [Candidatus Eremiobacteraeota bacterium]